MKKLWDKVMRRRFLLKTGLTALFSSWGVKLGAQLARRKSKPPVTIPLAQVRTLPENIVPPLTVVGAGRPYTFSSKLPWTPLDEGGFEQENADGRRMVIQKGGLTSVYDRDGKLVHSSTFSQAADLYQALVKSQEILSKIK